MGNPFMRGNWALSAYLLLVVGLALPGAVWADHEGHDHHAEHAAASAKDQPAKEWKGDPYLLDTDPVSGQKLGDKPIIYQHEGRELRFAGEDTLAKFKAEPAPYLAKVDQQMVQQQMPFYPLDTCLVTGEKLEGMGKTFDVVHKNRLVRLCCRSCRRQFQKDPAKYIDKLDQAVIAKQKGKNAATACPVSKERFGGEMGEPINLVVGNRLVELCCKSCVADFNKNPLKYLSLMGNVSKVDHAANVY